ncbi:MAG: phosphate ABC transporter substrate-binding protein PstS, partial [Leptolyngbyaceae cyanobacterium CRU_2_3]|nr:phosphate ABC transporter substrate-binding protein PstS [Leptolyngbyaceae cyanobacterium CRU_2_3]
MTSQSRLRRRTFLATLTAVSMGLAVSCAPSSPDVATSPSAGTSPAAGGGSATLSGAGASFPAPLYQRWFADYNKANPGVQISYQSVGSRC